MSVMGCQFQQSSQGSICAQLTHILTYQEVSSTTLSPWVELIAQVTVPYRSFSASACVELNRNSVDTNHAIRVTVVMMLLHEV